MRETTYVCDDCGREDAFASYVKARRAGWAVSKDYKNCYCPNCAPDHRRGQAAYKNDEPPQFPPPGFEQLKIENLG